MFEPMPLKKKPPPPVSTSDKIKLLIELNPAFLEMIKLFDLRPETNIIKE
jgi:hypothetical protein